MRELLFRGKRIDNGEWIYGDLIQDGKGYIGIWEQTPLATNYQVDPSTVGQFTGVTDKNGKNIFEGDIVEVYVRELDEIQNHLVEWDNTSACFVTNFACGVCSLERQLEKQIFNYIEVVGNIYDSPQLHNRWLEVPDND